MSPVLSVAVPGVHEIPVPNRARTWLHLTVDEIEHQRRQKASLGAILNWETLRLLMELPVGESVPMRELADRARVWRLHRGTAVIERDLVTRLAVKPVRVHRAIVAGPATRRSLERTGRFAPYCARTLLIPKPPHRASLLFEADFYGIGVALDHGHGEHEVLLAERPWKPRRHTVAGWRFIEQAYGWWLACNEPAGR